MIRTVLRDAMLLLPLWLGLAACAVNPATGGLDFMLVSHDEEKEIGRETHRQVLAEFGGVYYDPGLSAYVDRVGRKLASVTENQDFAYSFTILNSPTINAFALPGGYVYVTRGLLALISNEAELAGVLGHELAHVNARHGAQRLSRMKARNRICETFICDSDLPVLGDLAMVGARLAFGGFTQDQELEADAIGVRYMQRTNYQTGAMTTFLSKLKAQGELDARVAGLAERQPGSHSYSATHPLTQERIERAMKLSAKYVSEDPRSGATDYLAAVDGLLYGNSQEYGFVIGRHYAHPIRRFTFTVPQGYALYSDSRQIRAIGPNGALILVEPSRLLFKGTIQNYLTKVWAADITLEDVRAFDINGMAAATGWLRQETTRGRMDFRLIAVRVEAGVIYRFLFMSPARMTDTLALGMRQATYSFRRLSEAEASALKPQRVRVVTVGPGEDIASLAALTTFADYPADRLSILNGLAGGESPAPGGLFKLVRE